MGCSSRSLMDACSRAARAYRSASSTSLATSRRRLRGLPRKRRSIPRRQCATSSCETVLAIFRSCTRRRLPRLRRWGCVPLLAAWRIGEPCRRSTVSTLTGFWRFGTLLPPISGPVDRLLRVETGGGGTMIKSELVQRVAAQNPHLYQRDVENIINAILGEIIAAMARGDRVELRGFGAFSVKNRRARAGRNPRTGAHVAVDQKSVPFFKTGKEMRERLNRPQEHQPTQQ